MRKLLSLSILLVLMLGWACTEEETETTVIVTEEVLYTSAENVRLLGRLITNQSINLADHGFYISEDENFSQPIIISLGAKSGPGRFIGESSELTNSKTYYAKAFMDLGGEIQYGNIIELTTLSPQLDSFSPAYGQVGGDMIILGQNFTEDAQVFIGDSEAVISSIDFESRIHIKIPPTTSPIAVVKVLVQDKTLSFPISFEYQSGVYTQLSNYPESVRLFGNIFYSNNSGLNIGLGTDSKTSFFPKIYQYSVIEDNWIEVASPGVSTAYGFSTQNFFGGGAKNISNDLYDIDYSFFKINNGSYEKLSDLPFSSRESIAFEDTGSLFVLGGKEGNTLGFWNYNPVSKTWTSLPNSPLAFSKENAHFLYQNKLYIVDSTLDLWEYAITSGTWTIVSTYPGKIGLGYGMGEVIGSKAYVGLYQRNSEIWELDLTNFTWKPKNNIPGQAQELTVAHFEKDGFLYIMRMPEVPLATNNSMRFYKFDPNGI